QNAFKACDCMVAIGTRFSEIATGSYGATAPENLIHVDINPDVFNANFPAKVAISGDAGVVLRHLLKELEIKGPPRTSPNSALREQIRADKAAYRESWYRHDAPDIVNPARFFDELRSEEHTSELQSLTNLACPLLLQK